MIPLTKSETAAEKHFDDIKDSLIKRIEYIISKEGINHGTIELSPELKIILEGLKDEASLKELILCKPEELTKKIEEFRRTLPDSISLDDKNRQSDFEILYRIFVNYGYDPINKLEFINRISLDTCPYCNRGYIYTLDEDKKIKPEIDHFYPKGIYPFLAASYYNLIPSCQTCNGFGGKSSDDTHTLNVVSPYLINHDDFKFSYDVVSINILNPISTPGSIKVKLIKKINENALIFKLDDLYEKHEDHVAELIVKAQLEYSESYREYLKNYKKLKFNDDEIDRMIVGNYTSELQLHKRPLAKLYRDIAIEEGLIKSTKA